MVGCYHSGGTNDEQKRKDRATQPMDHGRLRLAIFIDDAARIPRYHGLKWFKKEMIALFSVKKKMTRRGSFVFV